MFSYHDGDVFGCVADIGWITGHSYIVYGPLANGATTVLFESTPVYPDPGGEGGRGLGGGWLVGWMGWGGHRLLLQRQKSTL